MDDSRTSRREFCVHACQAASLLTVASLIDACAGNPNGPDVPALPTINAAVSGGAINVIVDANSPLASTGGAALVQTSSGNVLVARTGTDTFAALTALCTHQDCTITGFQNGHYVCPCHLSQFSLTGSVLLGPAAFALRQFATRFSGNVLTITVA